VPGPDASDLQDVLRAAAFVVVVGVPFALLARKALHGLLPDSSGPRARWGLVAVAYVALVGFVLIVAGGVVLRPLGPQVGVLVELVGSAVIFGLTGLVALAVAGQAQPDGRTAIGFPGGGALRPAAVGVLVYVLSSPMVVGMGGLSHFVSKALGHELPPQEVGLRLAELGGAARYVALALAVLVQPFLEELLFRGFLQPFLVTRTGVTFGIALTSLAFAGLHGLSVFLPIFTLSVVLGAVRHRSGRVSASWTVHALHNGIQLAALYWFPQIFGGSS